MIKYKIIHKPGTSSSVIERDLNNYSKEGFILIFMNDGWFVMGKVVREEDEEKEKKGGDHGRVVEG